MSRVTRHTRALAGYKMKKQESSRRFEFSSCIRVRCSPAAVRLSTIDSDKSMCLWYELFALLFFQSHLLLISAVNPFVRRKSVLHTACSCCICKSMCTQLLEQSARVRSRVGYSAGYPYLSYHRTWYECVRITAVCCVEYRYVFTTAAAAVAAAAAAATAEEEVINIYSCILIIVACRCAGFVAEDQEGGSRFTTKTKQSRKQDTKGQQYDTSRPRTFFGHNFIIFPFSARRRGTILRFYFFSHTW